MKATVSGVITGNGVCRNVTVLTMPPATPKVEYVFAKPSLDTMESDANFLVRSDHLVTIVLKSKLIQEIYDRRIIVIR